MKKEKKEFIEMLKDLVTLGWGNVRTSSLKGKSIVEYLETL